MSKFNVGDKVKVIKYNTFAKKEYLGKILEVESRCDVPGTGEEGYALVGAERFRFFPNELEKVNETIAIYRKDNEVIALDKSNGKKAVAKCSPEDKFNFRVGAKLAFTRLMGEELVKKYNKVREVKRKAELGEYIKIVKPSVSFGKYFKDDVLKVVNEPLYSDCVVVENKNGFATVGESEYVVLENYEPPKKEKSCKCDGGCKEQGESEEDKKHKQHEDFVSAIADLLVIGLCANILKGDE